MDPLKTIFGGQPGTSKTVQIYDYPRPMIVANIDRKIHTINYLFKKVVTKKLPDYSAFRPDEKLIQHIPLQAREFGTIESTLNQIIADPPMSENGDPGVFVVDSLTTLADNTIKYTLSMRGEAGKSIGVIQIPDLPEWLGESMFLGSLFTDLKDLPCHVILIGHMTVTERDVMVTKAEKKAGASGGTTRKVTRQLTTGGTKIGAKVPVWFDEVYNFQNIPSSYIGEQGRRMVFTGPTEEMPFARNKLGLPYQCDITYPYNVQNTNGETGRPLFDYIKDAMAELGDYKDD